MIINLNTQREEKATISRQRGKEESTQSGKIYTFLIAKKSIYTNIINGCLSTLRVLIVEMQQWDFYYAQKNYLNQTERMNEEGMNGFFWTKDFES